METALFLATFDKTFASQQSFANLSIKLAGIPPCSAMVFLLFTGRTK
jgi:hypothetical protein